MDVRTFEARCKGDIKIKTCRMKPGTDNAFPIPTWQTALENIKNFAKERVEDIRSNIEQEEDAKIVICEARIKDTKCWHMYNSKEKKKEIFNRIYSVFI